MENSSASHNRVDVNCGRTNFHPSILTEGAPVYEQKELRKQRRVPQARFCEWRGLNGRLIFVKYQVKNMTVNVKKIIISPIVIRVLTVCLGFISNVLINRSLGLELKGQFTIILNYANILQMLLNLGICYAYPLLRNKNGEEQAKDSIITIIWLQTIILILASFSIAIFGWPLKGFVVTMMSAVMICNSQIVFIALIDDINHRNLFLLFSTILYIVLNVIAFCLFNGNLYVIIGLANVKYIFEIVILAKYNRYFRFKRKVLSRKAIREILKIGISTAALAVLISCNYNIDIFMLNWMGSGDLQIGIYSVAYSLANMLWILPDAFKELIYHKTARKDDYRFVLMCILINMIFCIVICIGFALLGKWFLAIVYGKQYVTAYYVTLTLFIGIVPMVAFKLIHPIYVNHGKSGIVAVFLVIAVLVNIISSWILIPSKGAYGAAVASVVSYALCGVLFLIRYYLDFCRKGNDNHGAFN